MFHKCYFGNGEEETLIEVTTHKHVADLTYNFKVKGGKVTAINDGVATIVYMMWYYTLLEKILPVLSLLNAELSLAADTLITVFDFRPSVAGAPVEKAASFGDLQTEGIAALQTVQHS
jgi:hypothetical protein